MRIAATPTACLFAVAALAAAQPAHAQWRLQDGLAVVAPDETNSTLQLFAVACGDPFQLEIYAAEGPVRAHAGDTTDYFYQPGRIIASVDGHDFPLVAAGSDVATVLFSEGTAAENFMGPVDRDFIEAMRVGRRLTIYFDITRANASDGSPFETFAHFSLAGASETLAAALVACG